MRPAVALAGLVLLLDTTFGAEDSCLGRCGSFDAQRKCQCDSMCVYYESCCADFSTICPKKVSRGDVFEEAEEIAETGFTTLMPTANTVTPTLSGQVLQPNSTQPPTAEPDAGACSGRPFDAFLQLKNGSIYAFRGKYFFELDDKSVLPGYPKLIEDVWGVPGPISAAFTRINCQGKTYIFKGDKYWRFDGDVLDADYPRNISTGFEGIPSNMDAAFAVPAPSHRSKEKAYFFKDDKYYQYEFIHQPSHEECVRMNRFSSFVLFTRYTDLFCAEPLDDLFTDLFGSHISHHDTGPRLISRDWYGVRPPVDAAMVGHVHLIPKPTLPSPPARRRSSWKRRLSRRRRPHHLSRPSRSLWEDFWPFDDSAELGDGFLSEESTVSDYKSSPGQNVYFFKRDKYFRVSLKTKRVDVVNPPYPRSIAKYWLGCEREQTSDSSRAEKK